MGKKRQTEKEEKPKEKRGQYDEKLKVNGSFLDIVKAAVKSADVRQQNKSKGTTTSSVGAHLIFQALDTPRPAAPSIQS